MSSPIKLLVPTTVVTMTDDPGDPYEIARFRDDLQTYTSLPVSIQDSSETAAGDNAMLVVYDVIPDWVFELPPSRRADTLGRVFLLQAPRPPGIFQELERHRIAGAIDTLGYSSWQHHPDRSTGYGIAGRQEVIEKIGGKLAGRGFASEHYAIYGSPTATNLPQAIVEYLDALARMHDVGPLGA